MTAEIISIGDELLIGQIVNTNAATIGEHLSAAGVQVARVTTVGDAPDAIIDALQSALDAHDAVLITGGLGPTHDDVTRTAIVRFFGTRLVFSEDAWADIERMFARLRRPVLDAHRDQAMVPEIARMIRNTHGTAPGYHIDHNGKFIFVMPGVPFEMLGMLESYVLPFLRARSDTARASCTILTTGIPESLLALRLAPVHEALDGATLAYLPSPLGVRVRVTVAGGRGAGAQAAADEKLAELRAAVIEHAGDFVFGEGTRTLEEVVVALLCDRHLRIAVAESCTGGLVTDRITNVPGSSIPFDRGMVVYSNESKTAMLGVDPALIAAHGAVSHAVAIAMAAGARAAAGTEIGLSTTGIAGPGGATPEKPVGLVWIGLAAEGVSAAYSFHFGDNRVRTKQRAAQAALELLRRHLLGLPLRTPLTTDSMASA